MEPGFLSAILSAVPYVPTKCMSVLIGSPDSEAGAYVGLLSIIHEGSPNAFMCRSPGVQ